MSIHTTGSFATVFWTAKAYFSKKYAFAVQKTVAKDPVV